jgi:hypothetical protein
MSYTRFGVAALGVTVAVAFTPSNATAGLTGVAGKAVVGLTSPVEQIGYRAKRQRRHVRYRTIHHYVYGVRPAPVVTTVYSGYPYYYDYGYAYPSYGYAYPSYGYAYPSYGWRSPVNWGGGWGYRRHWGGRPFGGGFHHVGHWGGRPFGGGLHHVGHWGGRSFGGGWGGRPFGGGFHHIGWGGGRGFGRWR